MGTTDTELIVEGQRTIATSVVSGTVLSSGGTTDTQCIVATNNGPQRAWKTFIVGMDAGASLFKFGNSLPETGENGFLYGVYMPDKTRDGYAIIQFFVWDNDDWAAVGAFDVDLDPNGLVYEDSFDSATGSWVVTVNHQ